MEMRNPVMDIQFTNYGFQCFFCGNRHAQHRGIDLNMDTHTILLDTSTIWFGDFKNVILESFNTTKSLDIP